MNSHSYSSKEFLIVENLKNLATDMTPEPQTLITFPFEWAQSGKGFRKRLDLRLSSALYAIRSTVIVGTAGNGSGTIVYSTTFRCIIVLEMEDAI